MSQFPKQIMIKIVDEKTCKPIPNIVVSIKVYAKQKNDYYLLTKPSNNEGVIEITREWLYDKIKKEQQLFIMDYSSYHKDRLLIKILTKEEVNKALDSLKLYKDILSIPDRTITELENVDNRKYKSVSKEINLDREEVYELTLSTKKKFMLPVI